MNETLHINPKFEQIIPPLSEDELSRLEENIIKHGKVTDPIKTWNGIIIDGHHRYKIIQKYPEIPFTIIISFLDMGTARESSGGSYITKSMATSVKT